MTETQYLDRDQAFARLTRDYQVPPADASRALNGAADPAAGSYLLRLPDRAMTLDHGRWLIPEATLVVGTARGAGGLRFTISGAPDRPADPAKADALLMDALRGLLQGYIGASTPRPERTAMFSVDGAAYYLVTPAQRNVLLEAAPERIRKLNEESPHGEYTDPRKWLREPSGWSEDPAPPPSKNKGLNEYELERQLQELGYAGRDITRALRGARQAGVATLGSHRVYRTTGNRARRYSITERPASMLQPVTFDDTPDEPLRSLHSEGHELARQQIARHGKDRYPSPAAQYGKVLDEAGELGEALISWAGTEAAEDLARVRSAYADVGLALFALGDKLGLDLTECMRELAGNDTRSFRD